MEVRMGEKIRQLRKQKGISQEVLAQVMGVTFQAVSKWETGRTLPDAEALLKLSRLLAYDFEQNRPVDPDDAQPIAAKADDTETVGRMFRRPMLWLLLAAALVLVAGLSAGIAYLNQPQTAPSCPLMLFPVNTSVTPTVEPLTGSDKPSVIYRFSIQNVSEDLAFAITDATIQLHYPDGAAPFQASYDGSYVASALGSNVFKPGDGNLWMGAEPAERGFSGVTMFITGTDSAGREHTVSGYVDFAYPDE